MIVTVGAFNRMATTMLLSVVVMIASIATGNALPTLERDSSQQNQVPSTSRINGDTFYNMILPPGKSEADCDTLAAEGRCAYYACLERQLSCDHTHSLVRTVSHAFCHRAKLLRHTFTAQGQDWIEKTNVCTMRHLVAEDRLAPRQCADARKHVTDTFVECAGKSGLCDIIWSDRQHLIHLFTEGDWMTIIMAGRNCSHALVSKFIHWSLRSLYA